MILKLVIFHFLLLLSTFMSAQIEIIPAKLNFGTTGPSTEWVIDVHIKNKSGKKDYLLTHQFSHEYQVLFTSKTLMPDSSIVMRVKFQPREKAVYNEKIELYFASMEKPVILPVYAEVAYLNPQDHIPCPDFSRLAAFCCADNMFMVEVVDDATGVGISAASVEIHEEHLTRLRLKTMVDGKVSNSIPIGYYQVIASHADYISGEYIGYINHSHSRVIIRLKKKEKPSAKSDTLLVPIATVEEDKPILVTTNDSLISKDELLPSDRFRPNNVVLLLDVSSSMAKDDKLDLMKLALKQLVAALRPQDKITLISYADEAKVLLPTTSGDQNARIMAIVNELHADGSTSGAKGFAASYQAIRKAFIKGGNNQLMVVTDGVFQPQDQADINKLVKRSARKNITTSIVGIQCVSFAELKLSEVCVLGHGSFLVLNTREDLNLLIEELKKRSAS